MGIVQTERASAEPVDADVGGPHPLAHHRGARIGMLADARKPARKHDPAPLAVACGEDPQRERARRQRVLGDHRHGREAHDLLPDIILRAARHVVEQGGALVTIALLFRGLVATRQGAGAWG